MLVSMERSSAVLVMISSKSVSICNHSHDRAVNSRKNNDFVIDALFDAVIRGESPPSGTKFGHTN